MKRLNRSIENPIREDLKWDEKWKGPDSGLIWSWERGRQKRVEDPDLAEKAEKGELLILPWKGGVEKNTKNKKKYGSLKYLAMWQGLRNEDLDIDIENDTSIKCAITGKTVVFTAKLISLMEK
jgi:hypothetical protein